MDQLDGRGLGGHEDLVAPGQMLSAKILGRQILALEMRAGGSVEAEDLVAEE